MQANYLPVMQNPVRKKGNKWGGCGGGLLMGAIFGILGMVLAVWGYFTLTDARASLGWPTADGRVVRSDMDHSTDSDGDDTYTADILYQYDVNDQSYENNRIRYSTNSNGSPGPIQADLDRYPVGRRVDVYYAPDNPANSVLEPGVTGGSYLLVCMGAFFLFLTILLVPLMVLPTYLKNR